MGKFEFYGVGRIVFGRGEVARVGMLAAGLGRKALVVSNGGEALAGRVAGYLTAAGVGCVMVAQRGEPTVADVDGALEVARRAGCDMAIGVGGGSAIDAAKAVAGLLTNGGGALDYMEVVGKGQKIVRASAPWMAVPCTAGTGAEVTRNAVIGYPEKSFKASLRSEHLLARVALVDPELGVGVPPAVTARTGMDALCQCIEAYTSNGAQAMTDGLALEGVERAGRSLRRAFRDGGDVAAREDMALAALYSGIALTNAGLGAVHGFAAPLGARYPVPHGTVCAALLGPVMAANVVALRAAGNEGVLARYARIGGVLTGEENEEAGIGFVRELCRDLRIERLGVFGLKEAEVGEMVGLARKSSSMRYNPVVLSEEALAGVLREAL